MFSPQSYLIASVMLIMEPSVASIVLTLVEIRPATLIASKQKSVVRPELNNIVMEMRNIPNSVLIGIVFQSQHVTLGS